MIVIQKRGAKRTGEKGRSQEGDRDRRERQKWAKTTGGEKTGVEIEVRTEGQTPRPVTDVDKETEGETERQKRTRQGEGQGEGSGELDK